MTSSKPFPNTSAIRSSCLLDVSIFFRYACHGAGIETHLFPFLRAHSIPIVRSPQPSIHLPLVTSAEQVGHLP